MYSGCEISVSFIYFKYSLWFVTCIFTFLMITFNKLILIIIFNIINNKLMINDGICTKENAIQQKMSN